MGSGGQGSEVRGSSGARWAGNGWRQLCCQVEEQGAGVEVGVAEDLGACVPQVFTKASVHHAQPWVLGATLQDPQELSVECGETASKCFLLWCP